MCSLTFLKITDRLISHGNAFSAFTLLAGRQEEHPACKSRELMCWCGYLPGGTRRLSAYGPANATAYRNLIISCLINPDWFCLSGTGYRLTQGPGCPGKDAVKVVLVICLEQDVDLHMAQLTPLPLTVSCAIKIQIGFSATGSPG